jgi:hypothetical protein
LPRLLASRAVERVGGLWAFGRGSGQQGQSSQSTPPAYGLLSELEEALGALTPIPERRVASSAFCWGEVGIEDRTLFVPLRPLGARHLTNHQSTGGNLLTDLLELRLALRGCSFLHSSHLQSLVAEATTAVISVRVKRVRFEADCLGSARREHVERRVGRWRSAA